MNMKHIKKNNMKKEEGRRRKKDEEGGRRRKRGGRRWKQQEIWDMKTEENLKNRKIYQKGAQTDALKPSKKDTRVDIFFFRWVAPKPLENSVSKQDQKNTPETPISSKLTKTADVAFPKISLVPCWSVKFQ